ncbi:MAG: hypothetical protein M3R35_04615 [Candidatus Eremiobacteraeota bacterium]|nr:hypothetical protein [Candidatus Eremiobacteraeota bacterium]
MFANALFVIAIISLTVTSVLTAGLAMTRASIARTAQNYLAAGYERSALATRDTIAGALRSGAIDARALAPLPVLVPAPRACANAASPCSFFTDARATFINTVDVAPVSVTGPPCDGTTTNCGANLESNTAVNEGRIAARITVDVTAPDGTLLATRTKTAIFRTFAVPPYVTIAGSRDATFEAGNASEGDDGGLMPQSSADETVVRVRYHNDATGAVSDGSRWQQQGWSNGSAATGTWSP